MREFPYLAGLVRPCEVERGSIEHALAFAYDAPGAEFVYPAGKSDGSGAGLGALPEGARLQLDPALTEAQIRVWGCVGACLTIARALQRFGMYVVDNSGRAKVMMEFAGTARWKGGLVSSKTASPIPLSAFKVLAFASGASPAAPSKKKVKPSVRGSKRLAVDRYRVRGRKLRAGRKFAARLTLRPSARYKRIPAGLRIACPARIGSQSVNVLRSRLMGASSRARVSAVCLWAVPAGTSGKRFRASVTVGYKGGRNEDSVCREDPQGPLSASHASAGRFPFTSRRTVAPCRIATAAPAQ